MGDINSRRIFIDQYCFGLLNHLLTPKDFSQKNFSSNNITVLDGKEKDLNFIMKFQEETMIYIMKPNKKFFDKCDTFGLSIIHQYFKSFFFT